jgi:hypothetical protein
VSDEPKYFQVRSPGSPPSDPASALAIARRRAEEFSAAGHFFGAGYVLSNAVNETWGNPTLMLEAHEAAIACFQQTISGSATCSLEALAALHKLRMGLLSNSRYFGADDANVSRTSRELTEELAQRLLVCFSDSPDADGFLVRGVEISTDLADEWLVSTPDYEVNPAVERSGARLTLNLPSAFWLFRSLGDYEGAKAIIDQRPSAFVSPGLLGWKAATMAFVDEASAVHWFDEAAEQFGRDTAPAGTQEEQSTALALRGGWWSAENEMLWAKYFRARARMAEASKEPTRVRELVATAAASLAGTDSGFVNTTVSRFRILIELLDKLLSEPTSLSKVEALKKYEFEQRAFGRSTFDEQAIAFIERVTAAMDGYAADPNIEATRTNLPFAIEALRRIPFVGGATTDALTPALSESVRAGSLEGVTTWVHRTLESITNEATLRSILLRLIQAAVPLYAQIRHGPIEFGKDLVALVDIEGRTVLRLYQVKCGDLSLPKWRESKDELDELLTVPVSTFQLPKPHDAIEGFLVVNGHVKPNAEPAMEAWFAETRKRGYSVEFMHLDKLVRWIFTDGLESEFRAVLREVGIAPVMPA